MKKKVLVRLKKVLVIVKTNKYISLGIDKIKGFYNRYKDNKKRFIMMIFNYLYIFRWFIFVGIIIFSGLMHLMENIDEIVRNMKMYFISGIGLFLLDSFVLRGLLFGALKRSFIGLINRLKRN